MKVVVFESRIHWILIQGAWKSSTSSYEKQHFSIRISLFVLNQFKNKLIFFVFSLFK